MMQEYIFGLDIPMDDVVIVHELNSVADLVHVFFHLLLRHTILLLQVAEKAPSSAVLHHQVDEVLVVEVVIKTDNVGMLQVALNLYLAS